MSGTRAYALKRLLIDRIDALPALKGVQVKYTYPGRDLERECVFGGKVVAEMQPAAMRHGGLQPRTETIQLSLHLYVMNPGEDNADATEARIVEIGTAVEEFIAGNPVLADDLPGLQSIWVSGYELESGLDDEDAISSLDYQITALSYLT